MIQFSLTRFLSLVTKFFFGVSLVSQHCRCTTNIYWIQLPILNGYIFIPKSSSMAINCIWEIKKYMFMIHSWLTKANLHFYKISSPFKSFEGVKLCAQINKGHKGHTFFYIIKVKPLHLLETICSTLGSNFGFVKWLEICKTHTSTFLFWSEHLALAKLNISPWQNSLTSNH